MIQIYEDDTGMIVNHDPHHGHHGHHDHAYPFNWVRNATINYGNETYLSDTSIIFMGLFCACFMVKVLAICTDYYSRARGRPLAQRTPTSEQGPQVSEQGPQVSESEQAARIARQIKINSKTRVIAGDGSQGELQDELLDGILDECSICLDNFDAGQTVCELSCHHLFHKGCLEQWMQDNHNCPLCRLSV
jgi:hypothetical protein